jgi:hypothetical protein
MTDTEREMAKVVERALAELTERLNAIVRSLERK